MNSFGMLCAAITKDSDTGKEEQIMNIAVPKHLSNKSESIMSNITVGMNVFVEIIGKKYELKKSSISAIGKLIINQSKDVKLDDTNSKIAIPEYDDGEFESVDDAEDADDDDDDDVRSLSEQSVADPDDRELSEDELEDESDNGSDDNSSVEY
jgi:hypothetical protein